MDFYKYINSVSNHYYDKLRKLVDSGRLSVYIVIAPPRSNSSIVEHALGFSPDIQHECHEPFLGARKPKFETDIGYKHIYESIGGEIFEKSTKNTSVVVKEMAHWIDINDEYKNLVALTNQPVITLIRNPLLTVESRIRRVLKGIDMRHNLNLQQSLLDLVARDSGYKDRFDFLAAPAADIEVTLSEIQTEGADIKRLYNMPLLSIQNDLLNYLARKSGYINWRDLTDRKLYQERDYHFFEPILKLNVTRGHFEETEFQRLDEIIQFLKHKKQPYVVFDTTDLRAEPTSQLGELCTRLGVHFSPEMIKWGEKPVNFHTQQHHEYEKIWYDKLFSSSEINPPTEISPTLEMFPEFVQKYLYNINLPIYAGLSKEKIISDDLKKEINGRRFKVSVNESNQASLQSLGVIDSEEIGIDALVELRNIDPVYAVTNEPLLTENKEFQSRKQRYSKEIKIVAEALK